MTAKKKLIKTKDATKTAKTLNRGKTLEETVKDDFLKQDIGLSVVESQTIKEKIIKGCKFPFRATIDYILSNNSILECKTKEINDTTISIERWKSIKEGAIPFDNYIQCQAQMWLHEKETCNIHIAGVNKEHQILDSKTFVIGIDTKIIRAITASLVWFSAEFEKGSMKSELPTEPIFFMKPDTALVKGNSDVYLPDFSEEIHFECELVVKIDKAGKFIQKEFAKNYYSEISLGLVLS